MILMENEERNPKKTENLCNDDIQFLTKKKKTLKRASETNVCCQTNIYYIGRF